MAFYLLVDLLYMNFNVSPIAVFAIIGLASAIFAKKEDLECL